MGPNFVPETRFGLWFQGTLVWTRYVLESALSELFRLADNQLPTNAVVLDAGCGEGAAFPILNEQLNPQHIIGVELEPHLIAGAREAGNELPCNVTVLEQDVCTSNIESNSVDIILCHQTLHHLPDQQLALQEFRRLLKPGGFLLLSESCQAFIESWRVKLFFRHPDGSQHTADDYLDMLRAADFDLAPARYSLPVHWWAQPNMGLLDKFGFNRKKETAKLICAVATLPASE